MLCDLDVLSSRRRLGFVLFSSGMDVNDRLRVHFVRVFQWIFAVALHDVQTKCGLVATGLVHDDELWRNIFRPADNRPILTNCIGSIPGGLWGRRLLGARNVFW